MPAAPFCVLLSIDFILQNSHAVVDYWYCIVLLLRFRHPTVFMKALCFRLARSSFHSSRQIVLTWYLMNGLNNFDKTDMEYSLAPTDNLFKFYSRPLRSNLLNPILRALFKQSRWNLQCITTIFCTSPFGGQRSRSHFGSDMVAKTSALIV